MAIRNKRCFLDQDGVLADFVGGACVVHGRPSPFLDAANAGEFELIKIWGMTPDQFWAPIDAVGSEFWRSLSPTAEAEAIVHLVQTTFGPDNVAVLTAPSDDPQCVPGKRAWMRQHFPQLARKMIFANASTKHFMACPGSFLVDDRDSNVQDFTRAGGQGILVPRPWNSLYGTSAVIETVRAGLYDLTVQRVPPSTQWAVRHWPVAATTPGRGRHPVHKSSDSCTTYQLTETPARGRGRGVASDDYCLLCCATCGTAFDSRKLHQCHPDASGPQC